MLPENLQSIKLILVLPLVTSIKYRDPIVKGHAVQQKSLVDFMVEIVIKVNICTS